MKKRYSTPEMEVEVFNIFTVFTDSSTGGGGIDQGGEEAVSYTHLTLPTTSRV